MTDEQERDDEVDLLRGQKRIMYRVDKNDTSARYQHEYVHLCNKEECWCCDMNVLHTVAEHNRRVEQHRKESGK